MLKKRGKVTMNSPGNCASLQTGMFAFESKMGENMVVMWWRRSGASRILCMRKFLKTFSSPSASFFVPGTPYHCLGAPL